MKILNFELLERIKINFKRRGIIPTIGLGLEFFCYKLFRSRKTFNFLGKKYNYFYHWYNTAWKNERAVEVPIIWKIVKEYHERRILEVGNVLSHYFYVSHDIVDKYEKACGVINEDIIDFKPQKKYDLIVSISTLEHVGFNEPVREPRKFFYAIENLKNNCLAPSGKIVFTVTLGYNPEMEKCLSSDKVSLTKCYFLKRISSKNNEWREIYDNIIRNFKKYNFHEDAILIGIIEKGER